MNDGSNDSSRGMHQFIEIEYITELQVKKLIRGKN